MLRLDGVQRWQRWRARRVGPCGVPVSGPGRPGAGGAGCGSAPRARRRRAGPARRPRAGSGSSCWSTARPAPPAPPPWRSTRWWQRLVAGERRGGEREKKMHRINIYIYIYIDRYFIIIILTVVLWRCASYESISEKHRSRQGNSAGDKAETLPKMLPACLLATYLQNILVRGLFSFPFLFSQKKETLPNLSPCLESFARFQ